MEEEQKGFDDKVTQPQLNLIHKLMDDIKKKDKNFKSDKFLKEECGVEHSNELTKVQASGFIKHLQELSGARLNKFNLPEAQSQPESDKFAVMELKDEDQIIQELEGRVLDEYVYSFIQAGKEITGLSWCGIKRIVQKMGDISVRIVSIDDVKDSYRVVCEATNHRAHLTMCGVSEQRKFFDADNKRADQFALQKATSKAQRNALRNLIPEPIMIETIKEWAQKQSK